ncbi:MAG TPA: metalloregulator ArsR/SmtB family transcription factor [Acidimicrobiia bacterium]|jgi:DNA-binding transcriptional ArsR family regulator
MTSDASSIGPVLAALADRTRLAVLQAVARHGEVTATALAAEMPVTRQAVAKHLSTLEAAGLVAGARAGREVRYHAVGEPLADTARWVAELGAEWDDRLARLASRMGPAPR